MMDKRKLRGAKQRSDPPNKAVQDLEPGASAPKAKRGQRVFSPSQKTQEQAIPPVDPEAQRRERDARIARETEARLKADADRQAAIAKARREAALARKKAEATARRKADIKQTDTPSEPQRHTIEAKRSAVEARRKQAEKEAEARKQDARERARAAEERRKAMTAERQRAEEAARRKAEETERHRAEEAARRKAEEAERHRAEETARRKAEEAERQRAEEAARRKAEEDKRQRDEATARDTIAVSEVAASTAPAAHAVQDAVAPPPVQDDVSGTWKKLRRFSVDERRLDQKRIITASRYDPAHTAFDVLRTKMLQTLSDNGWTRVAITSATQGCGKSFVAANLAISLSRQENCRSVLLDLDLRRPSLHDIFGVEHPGSIGDFLRGKTPLEEHLRRLGSNTFNAGRNIAFGFNGHTETYASELLQDPRTGKVLNDMQDRLKPNVILFDLPPALYYDDVMAMRPQFDGVLLVVGGGLTTSKEIKEVERRLGEDTPLLGTILNRAEGENIRQYSY